MQIGLRIGQERLYVIRSIPDFLEAMRNGETVSFGKGFTYFPAWMRFDAAGTRLIGLIAQHCASLRSADYHIGVQEARLLPLPAPIAAQVWETLRDLRYHLHIEGEEITQTGISQEPLPLSFTLSDRAKAGAGPHRLCVTAAFDAEIRPLTADWAYAVVDGTVTHVSRAQRTAARLCTQERTDGRTVFLFEPGQTQKVISELTLWLSRVGTLQFSPELESQLIRAPFEARIYLDREGREVTAHTDFVYGNRVIDPFLPVEYDDQLLLLVTCVDNDDERRVVAARRVRDGENEKELKKVVERSRKW